MTFFVAVEIFDLEDVFFFLLRNNISTCGRGVVATTLSFSFVAPGTSMVVLIFLASLALMGRLPTKHVSRRRVSGLILPGVLFFGWSMPSEIL